MERLAERLRGERLEALYASPLPRALDSARILSAAIGLEPIPRDGLREIRHGRWEGLLRSDVRERFGDEFARWEADPFHFAPEGGETGEAVLERARPVLEEIVSRHAGEPVVVVSHKATLRLLVCDLIGIDPRGYRDRLDQSPACLDLIDLPDGKPPRLVLFNDTSHL